MKYGLKKLETSLYCVVQKVFRYLNRLDVDHQCDPALISNGKISHRDVTVNPCYLPSSRAIAVSLVTEKRHIGHHPSIDLRQREPFLWRTLDGLCDEIGIR